MSSRSVTLAAADGASAEVYLYGAHVASWRPAPGGEERLFLSATSDLSGKSAIRGGIPVIFPQFAAEGPLPRHGFARTSRWEFEGQQVEKGESVARFSLTSSDATRAIWPAEFRATLTVNVGANRLCVALGVENRGAADISFTCALHTYLRVHDVADAAVIGFHGVPFRVSGSRDELDVDEEETLRIAGEVDRVYVGAPPRVILREATRELAVETTQFPDVVVWNPGARAASLADMEPGGERRMVCIEAAAVQRPIVLAPETRWSGTQTLIALPNRA
jgi:glucose-6-phosphate 1-epimerase